MSYIKVIPISVNTDGTKDYFGDETGTPEFYMVSDTLEKYLGEVYVTWDYTEFCFMIEMKDQSGDIYDYIPIIESIYEPFAPFNFVYRKNQHLAFEIIYNE
jgi:hypothetical protein